MAQKQRNTVSPEALPARPLLKVNTYEQGDEAFTLDTVCIKRSTGKKAHTYSAPMGNGEEAQRLRRYVLTLSRYELPDIPAKAKKWVIPEQAITATQRIVANVFHRHAYADDPSTNTVELGTLARVLSADKPSPQALYKALSFVETEAFDTLMGSITNPLVKATLHEAREDIERYLWSYDYAKYLHYINDPRKYMSKRAIDVHRAMAERLSGNVEELMQKQRRSEAERKKAEAKLAQSLKKGTLVPQQNGLEGDWEPLIVDKPPLEINHTGKMGRRIIATDTGRNPRYISRLVTDPDKRIFSRKTRALGGVVVIDNSGSMSLSERDLAQLMSASAGSTVVMYSSDVNATTPNCWVIARKGRQVRHIPDTPGGNGVDGPALVYATTLRDRRSQPIIWVSDGYVTGVRDASKAILTQECLRLQRKHNIIRVEDVQEAIKLMTKLQGKA
jgi:hypothetical protein